jgi:hypothetical protein
MILIGSSNPTGNVTSVTFSDLSSYDGDFWLKASLRNGSGSNSSNSYILAINGNSFNAERYIVSSTASFSCEFNQAGASAPSGQLSSNSQAIGMIDWYLPNARDAWIKSQRFFAMAGFPQNQIQFAGAGYSNAASISSITLTSSVTGGWFGVKFRLYFIPRS